MVVVISFSAAICALRALSAARDASSAVGSETVVSTGTSLSLSVLLSNCPADSCVFVSVVTGAVFGVTAVSVLVGTFSILVSHPNALNIDSLRRSMNLSVVLVIRVTTMSTPVIATIQTHNRAIWMMASTTISTNLRNPSRLNRRKLRNLSKLDWTITGAFSSE